MLEKIWRDFLRKYDLNSTWYYQDYDLAWAEYAVLKVIAEDGYSDAEDAYLLLIAENHPLKIEIIEKQLEFMSLKKKEERLIFHEILTNLLQALQSAKEQNDYIDDVYAVFHAVAQSEEQKKIKTFSDNFIYLPKGALLMYCSNRMDSADEILYQKFILSKPKLAKACFNELFSQTRTKQI